MTAVKGLVRLPGTRNVRSDYAIQANDKPPDDKPPGDGGMRDAILRIALDRFARDGYDATSTREICEDLSLARSGLYHYFRSKEEILFAAIEAGALKMESERDAVLARFANSSADVRLATILLCMARHAIEYQRNWRIINTHLRSLSPEHHATLQAHMVRTRSHTQAILDQGANEGLWPDIDLRLQLFTIFEIIHSNWYRPDRAYTPEDVADFNIRHIFAALGRPLEKPVLRNGQVDLRLREPRPRVATELLPQDGHLQTARHGRGTKPR